MSLRMLILWINLKAVMLKIITEAADWTFKGFFAALGFWLATSAFFNKFFSLPGLFH